MAEFAVWQQNVAYPARYDRALVAELLGEGVIDVAGGTLATSERSAGANMSVDVAAGRCVVDGDEQADQETYLCVFDDSTNLSVASADPDNPRKDRVIVRVQDSAVSGATDGPVREVLTGTAEASPTAPAVPDSAISLAIVDVAAGTSSITDANITDDRTSHSVNAAHQFVSKSGDTMSGPLEATEWFDARGPNGERVRLRSLTNGDGAIDLLDAAGNLVFRTRWEPTGRLRVQAGLRVDSGIDANSQTVTNVADPVNAQDAETKQSVDDRSPSGTYTGDGTLGQSIAVGFTPSFVVVQRVSDTGEVVVGGYTLSTSVGVVHEDGSGSKRRSNFHLESGGFQAGDGLNSSGATYAWFAYR